MGSATPPAGGPENSRGVARLPAGVLSVTASFGWLAALLRATAALGFLAGSERMTKRAGD